MASEELHGGALMPDIFTDDLAEALRLRGCVLCRVTAADEQRWMETFWREGRNSQEGRQRFYDGGGFCRRHAWLLHDVCVAKGSGAAIAAVYGALAQRDLELLDRTDALVDRRRGRRLATLARTAPCSACFVATEELERRCYFLVQLLRPRGANERYSRSDGLCFDHLASVVDVALGEDHNVALFLIRDWRHRLAAAQGSLAEFDRKRDHRYSREPKGPEHDSWTDVIRLYAGPESDHGQRRAANIQRGDEARLKPPPG
jgi:hypothetical protein